MSTPALTQVGAKTGEFRINQVTAGYQTSSFPLYTSTGDFLVVWADEEVGLIKSRSFDDSGDPLSSERALSAIGATGSPSEPGLVGLGNGSLLASWVQPAPFGSDGEDSAIGGRLLTASGVPLSSPFQINVFTAGAQRELVAAASPEGALVVWRSELSPGDDSDGTSVLARRLSSTGDPFGDDLQINTMTTGDQVAPAVAADGEGFVVVFEDSGARLKTRRVTMVGDPDPELEIATLGAGGAAPSPSITARPDGGFLVVWSAGGDLEGRFLDFLGAGDGPSFPIVSGLGSPAREPSVAAVGEGFAVVWTSFGAGSAGDDVDDAVLGQLMAADGRPEGAIFQVHELTTETQYRPAISSGPGADFVVVWTTSQGTGGDTDYAVAGRLLSAEGPFFQDDFESGDVSAWFLSVP